MNAPVAVQRYWLASALRRHYAYYGRATHTALRPFVMGDVGADRLLNLRYLTSW
jgi:hypothetical protein